MIALTDGFPMAVTVGSVEYDIDTDYRTALRIMEAFEDPGLTWLDRQDIALALLYGDNTPIDTAAAFDMAVFFLDCGEQRPSDHDGDTGERLYSFTHDARYIYSAIQMTHGIDLAGAGNTHWWRFCYLMQDLREDCYFQRMIYLRQHRSRGKLTKEERQEWMRNEHILQLPGVRDAESAAADDLFRQKYEAAMSKRA